MIHNPEIFRQAGEDPTPADYLRRGAPAMSLAVIVHLTETSESPMAFTVLLHAKAKSGRSHDVVDFYRETLAATRSRPGCIGIRVVRSIDDDTEFTLIEQWDDRAAQEAYVAWRTETSADVLVRFNELLSRPLSIDFYEEINA